MCMILLLCCLRVIRLWLVSVVWNFWVVKSSVLLLCGCCWRICWFWFLMRWFLFWIFVWNVLFSVSWIGFWYIVWCWWLYIGFLWWWMFMKLLCWKRVVLLSVVVMLICWCLMVYMFSFGCCSVSSLIWNRFSIGLYSSWLILWYWWWVCLMVCVR